MRPPTPRDLTPIGRAVTLCGMSRIRLIHGAYLLLLLIGIGPARADEIRQLDVSHDAGRYTVRFEVMLDAAVDRALPLMTDPAHWPQLSDIITESHVLAELPDGKKKVGVKFEGCILFICRTLVKTEVLERLPTGEITTFALPDQSDFLYAREVWRITGDDTHTRVEYQAELVPAFFVPPLIGPYLLQKKIRSLLTQTAHNLERLAR